VSYKGKDVRVIIVEDAKDEYNSLNQIVKDEISKGIKKSEHQTLLKSIKQKIDFLKQNPEYGKHIEKRKIPKEYIKRYNINNLWKVNLSSAWRMLYTIKGNEIEIIAVILDIIDHKIYDKKFGYKNR